MSRILTVLALALGALVVPVAATAAESCDPSTDVPYVIEFASLSPDAEPEVRCAPGAVGASALDGLDAAGVDYEQTTGDMPMVCRIDGAPGPGQEKCAAMLSGKGYWAFMVADEGEQWAFAQTGMADFTLESGQFVALKYHLMADGEKVEVGTPATAETRDRAEVTQVADADADATSTAEASEDGIPWSLLIAAVALVAVLGAAVAVARSRR